MLKSILQPVLSPVLSSVFGESSETPNLPVALESPISSDIASLSAGAYGFDRLVEGFSGNTVRLVRTNDNVQQDFGFDLNTGMFNYSAVESWRSNSNVNVVRFYNQSGGSVTLDAVGTVTFVVSNVVSRFGTTYSDQVFSATKTSGSPIVTVSSTTFMSIGMVVTGNGIAEDTLIETVDSATQITLSRNATVTETSDITVKNGQLARANVGGVGCNLNGNAHFVTSTNLSLNTVNGAEITMLYSMNNRRIASNASTIYGGVSAEERVFSYGIGTNNCIRARLGTGTNINPTLLKTSSTHTEQSINGGFGAIVKFAQLVQTFAFNTSSFGLFSKSAKEQNLNISAQGITDVSNGTLNNGLLVIGANFSNSTGVVSTTSRANMLFGGVVVHGALSNLQRYKVINKFHAIGQQHNIMSIDNLKALFSDIILHKNISTSTGIVSGEKSASTFNFNLPTIPNPIGTPTFTPNYVIPNIGVTGLMATSDTDNSFFSDDAMPPDLNGTVVSLSMSENTGNNLCTDLSVHDNDSNSTTTSIDRLSFSMARDHSQHSAMMRPYDINVIGLRYLSDRTSQFGAVFYDLANQMMGKYNRSVGATVFTYGETISSFIRTPSSWANHGNNSLQLDAPVISPVAENLNSTSKDGKLTLQIARFKAPTDYPKGGTIAVRTPYTLKSENALFLSQHTIIGHQDGSISKTKYGGVVDNAPNAKFKSFHGTQVSFSGVRVLWAWTPNVLTDDEISKVDINLYKLVV